MFLNDVGIKPKTKRVNCPEDRKEASSKLTADSQPKSVGLV